MDNQMDPALEQRLLRVAEQAGRKALADDAKPFTCFKCGDKCEDWDGSVCETCKEWFCDDCLLTDQQVMTPEICVKCADEAADIEATERSLRRPD